MRQTVVALRRFLEALLCASLEEFEWLHAHAEANFAGIIMC